MTTLLAHNASYEKIRISLRPDTGRGAPRASGVFDRLGLAAADRASSFIIPLLLRRRGNPAV